MMALMDAARLEQARSFQQMKKEPYCPFYMTVSSGNAARVTVENREYINFFSNNYLGFAVHPKVKEAVKAAVGRYGAGVTGSAVMSGTTDLHLALCEKVADLYHREAAMLFPSGYQTMLGAISAVVGRGDGVFLDGFAHRSLLDGALMSGASRFLWKHNDAERLAQLLDQHKGYPRKLVVVDSVYSMDGDIADLPEIVRVKKEKGAFLIVDEAHALGVIGPKGGGILDYYPKYAADVDVVAGTFSKFGGAVGGFIAGSKDFIDYVKVSAPGYTFTTALPPAICAGVLTALRLMTEEPEWRDKLWANIRFFTESLRSAGFDLGGTQSAVIPIYIRDTEKAVAFSKRCFESGVIASPVYHPVVPKGEERIRVGLSALHTQADLEEAAEIFTQAGKALSIISSYQE